MAFLAGETIGIDKVMNPRKDIYYFGIRSYEQGEVDQVLKHSIPSFTSEYCHNTPIEDLVYDTFRHFDWYKKKQPLWVSFDIDGLDADEFPSTGTPEPNGLQWKFVRELL